MADPVSIPGTTAAAAEKFGDRMAIADGDTRLSWTELLAAARTFGAALVASGIEPGDRIAIWAFNSAEWVTAMLGLSCAGATLVPIGADRDERLASMQRTRELLSSLASED